MVCIVTNDDVVHLLVSGSLAVRMFKWISTDNYGLTHSPLSQMTLTGNGFKSTTPHRRRGAWVRVKLGKEENTSSIKRGQGQGSGEESFPAPALPRLSSLAPGFIRAEEEKFVPRHKTS